MWTLNWIEIFLWYSCEQKCKFCFQKDLRYENPNFLSYDKVIEIIKKWIIDKKKSIVFSWWESTLDKNLIKYIKYCKQNWFIDIRVHTNWLSFSNYDKLKQYYDSWMTWVIVSIHGYWIIHDKLVKYEWAFENLKNTFLNLSKIKKINNKFVIDTNTVLTKFNYKSLHVLSKFLSYFPITRSQIVQLYSLYLFDIKEKKDLYVSYDMFRPYIWKILKYNNVITFENFPLCKIEENYWDSILKRQKYDNEAYWNMWEWFEESDCTYLDSCKNCLSFYECTWIPKDYLKIYKKEIFTL